MMKLRSGIPISFSDIIIKEIDLDTVSVGKIVERQQPVKPLPLNDRYIIMPVQKVKLNVIEEVIIPRRDKRDDTLVETLSKEERAARHKKLIAVEKERLARKTLLKRRRML